MPDLLISLSEHVTKDPELLAVQDDIIFARQEYAEWENHNNPHEYHGVVERMFYVRQELQRIVNEQKHLYPDVTFMLEYHQSCMLPKEAAFLVTSFSLQSRRKINGEESRLNSFICLRLEQKSDYSIENAAIKKFMEENSIIPYDDGSGEPCEIKFEQF